jgi:hypothetical protein
MPPQKRRKGYTISWPLPIGTWNGLHLYVVTKWELPRNICLFNFSTLAGITGVWVMITPLWRLSFSLEESRNYPYIWRSFDHRLTTEGLYCGKTEDRSGRDRCERLELPISERGLNSADLLVFEGIMKMNPYNTSFQLATIWNISFIQNVNWKMGRTLRWLMTQKHIKAGERASAYLLNHWYLPGQCIDALPTMIDW